MTIYQYVFYNNYDNDLTTIHGTDLYDVNKRAYEEYLTYWTPSTKTEWSGEVKQTFVEFCKHFAKKMYGGASFDDGYVDIKRDDFEVEV